MIAIEREKNENFECEIYIERKKEDSMGTRELQADQAERHSKHL